MTTAGELQSPLTTPSSSCCFPSSVGGAVSPLCPLSPVRRRQVSTVTIVRMEESLCGCSSLLSVLRCYVGKLCSNLLQAIIDHWNPRQTKLLEQRTLWYGPSLQGSSHPLLALQMCVDMISIISTYLQYLRIGVRRGVAEHGSQHDWDLQLYCLT